MRKIMLTVSMLILALGCVFIKVHAQGQGQFLYDYTYATYGSNSLLRPAAVYVGVNTSYLFIADSGHNQIDYFTGGTLVPWAGNGQAGLVDGALGSAEFNNPVGMTGPGFFERSAGYGAIPTTGVFLIVTDGMNHAVRQVCGYHIGNPPVPPECSTQGVTTVSGGQAQGDEDGTGGAAEFSYPTNFGTSATLQGLLIADLGNNAVRSVDSTGSTVQTAIASSAPGYQDGPLSNARFNIVTSLTEVTGSNPATLLADAGNYVIRKIDQSNNVTTFAGSGIQGYADGSASSARFASPVSVVYNSADSYTYVADAMNNCIRRIDTAGNVTTYAGVAGSPGLVDGSNSTAEFQNPTSIAIANGFMYIADSANNAIRQIDMAHQQVSTLIH